MKQELQNGECPRIAHGRYGEGPDYWERGRWGYGLVRRFVYFLHNEWPSRVARRIYDWAQERKCYALREWFNWSMGGTRWEWPWQPRTCSYCGGVHPEDALRLLVEGWDVEGTDKAYKHYLQPPNRRRLLGAYREALWSPVPPVKLYTMHFSPQQIEEWNKIVAQARKKEAVK